MILKNIRQDVPCCLLIQDTWSDKGRPLLLSLLHHYSANGYAIRYFKYDSLLHGEELGVHNFSTYMKLPVITNSKVTTEDILQEWKNGVKDEDKVIVAVDSLSPLIVNHTIGALCKAITRLCQLKNIHLVGLVHGDAHDEQTLKLIRHTSNCYLTVKTQDKKNFCQGILRKPGGKILDIEEVYQINEKGELINIQESSSTPVGKIQSTPLTPMPKSTFRLELNSSEEKARSQVVLPYIKKQSDKQSKGNILYEAEGADWEDEDPDDDLEI